MPSPHPNLIPVSMDKLFLDYARLDPGQYDPVPPTRGQTTEFVQRQVLIRSLQTFYRQQDADTTPADDEDKADLSTGAQLKRELIPIVTPYLGPLESSPTLSEIAPEPRLKACIAAWFFANRRNGVDISMEEIRRHVMQLVSEKRSAARNLRESIAARTEDEETIVGDGVGEDVEHETGGGGKGGNENDGVQKERVKKRKADTDQNAVTTTTTTTTTLIGGRDRSTMASDVTITRADNGYVKIEVSVQVPGTFVVEFKATQ